MCGANVQVSIVTYFMFGFQNDAGKFFIFFAAMTLAQLISESIGMLFAMMVATADLAIVLLSIVFILLLALTGFMVSQTPVYYNWIGYINFLRCVCELQGVLPVLCSRARAATSSAGARACPGLQIQCTHVCIAPSKRCADAHIKLGADARTASYNRETAAAVTDELHQYHHCTVHQLVPSVPAIQHDWH